MTTTQQLAELATDPQAFDTELARLHGEIEKATRVLQSAMDAIYRAAGARRRSTRQGLVWDASYDAAYVKVRETHPELVARVAEAQAAWRAIENEIQAMDRAYTGWTRFFPSVTKSQPHIHRSLSCHTLHATTVMSWAPSLSGKTEPEAVEELDEALCSVCFPSAPVALHEYVSKHSQADRDERQAAKDERAAKLAAKTLAEAEQFRTRRDHDRVTTVAECLRIIRQAVEQAVEVEWINQPARETEGTYPADMLARMRQNRADSLVDMEADAETAAAVLIAREAAHPGWGATAEAIAKTRASKLRSARKEWNL